MIIAFATCSNNFLAQAKTTFQSLAVHHPEIRNFLFIVDNPDDSIDYSFLEPSQVIFLNNTIAKGFGEMLARYDILELNTAVRPYIFHYLHEKHPEAQKILYLDPDVVVYGKLDEAIEILDSHDILITPHFLTPLPIDGYKPFENLALNYGTYNMGFFGLRMGTANTGKFLDWWTERTTLFGHIDPANGYFTDQIWFNLAPVFFEKVHTFMHPGYNMAAWNLHERYISSYTDNGGVMLRSGHPLIIYHFSSWNYRFPDELSRVYTRFGFEKRPDLVKLYRDYYEILKTNKIELFQDLACTLPFNKKTVKRSRVKKVLTPGVNLMRTIWRKI